jgi:hypothetical protein
VSHTSIPWEMPLRHRDTLERAGLKARG